MFVVNAVQVDLVDASEVLRFVDAAHTLTYSPGRAAQGLSLPTR